MKTALIIIHLIVCICVIVSVLLQPAKTQGLSPVITGGSAETFFGKNKSRTREGMLQKFTTVSMILFAITTILLIYYLNK